MNEKLLDRAHQKMRVVGSAGKETGKIVDRAAAHASPGVKHLAFLVFVVNGKGQLVLHKRSASKIGGGTVDSPVSHVLADETLGQAVARCLKGEYGIRKKLEIENLGGFSYEKDYGDGTCENEYCLVLVAEYSGKITPNPKEMDKNLVLMRVKDAIADVKKNRGRYAVWVPPAIAIFEKSRAAKKSFK